MARTFWFEPAKRGPVAGVSATPNAQPITFQQVVPEYFWTFIRLFRVKKLLALLLALGVCEFVTPCPRMAWSWRRGSESNTNVGPSSEVASWKSTAYSLDFLNNTRGKTRNQELFFLTGTYHSSTRLVLGLLTFLLTFLLSILAALPTQSRV
jgi:hypothetical protein